MIGRIHESPGETGPNHDRRRQRRLRRKGSILVLSAAMLVMIFAFAAFSVDVGYITLTKTKLQAACDASTMGAALDLRDGLGVAPRHTAGQTRSVCCAAAKMVAGRHEAGGQASVFLDETRDVRFGRATWDSATGSWQQTWDVAPYNMVRTTIRRDRAAGAPDGPLNLFFAPVIGHQDAKLVVDSTAALLPAIGFRVTPGSSLKAGVLPITLDEPTWDDLVLRGVGGDDYTFNEATGQITNGPDGVREVDLYPYGNQALPPGNRGTVDFGSSGNSTADIKRQILYGLNASDLSYFPGNSIAASHAHPLIINGDTGLSAGIKAQLEAIKGEPRAIPIFTEVHGNGNNANYTIVKFVCIRILSVKLTGNPKRVVVQPATMTDPTATRDETGTARFEDGVFTKPVLLQ